MDFLPLVGALHDAGTKLHINKSYIPLIGAHATILLHHLCNSMEHNSIEQDGVLWHKQNMEQTRYHTALSPAILRRAKKELLDEGLISIRQEQSGDRTAWWSVNLEKLLRFLQFAEALRLAERPDAVTLPQWKKWAAKNQDIVKEFRHLWPRLPEVEVRKTFIAKKPTTPKSAPAVSRLSIRCRYVDYWNEMDHVPKCRPGTKSYAFAREFFAAHRKYQAGQHAKFMLTEDVQKRINLKKVNAIPADVKRVGEKQTPVRSDAEMKKHIRMAAKAYDPKYAPLKKDWLGNLSNFLYRDGQFNKNGTSSFFLERLTSPPQLIEDESYEHLLEQAEDFELDFLKALQRLYNSANDRERNESFTLAELKSGLSVVRKILKEYAHIPVDEIGILNHHFADYSSFIEWWEGYCEDHLWQGMPITAFAPGKDLWRKFVYFVSADIGFNILTGERV